MGKKSKKKFISKGSGQHFYLMHRSQTDGAYAEGETPSDYVLVNSNQTNAVRPAPEARGNPLEQKAGKDHFDAMGFRKDGYDYSKHLKEMGGGHFVGVDGKSQALPAPTIIDLPASALPSKAELDRALQSITIDPDLMDPDLKAALFEDDDGEGGFEELQDDFISQCLTEPEAPDFDYDAHIANLIAMSEHKGGVDEVGARGWGEGETGGLKGFNKSSLQKRGVRFAGDEEDEDDDSGEFESYCSDDDREGGPGRGEGLDDMFDKTLEEYGSDDMGDLEDEAEDIQGILDVNEEGTLLDEALNEFMTEKDDMELTDGVKLSEIERVAKGARFLPNDVPSENGLSPEEIAVRVKELQLDSAIPLPAEEEDSPAVLAEVWKCQEYLAEEREEEHWDCETILTTYSTLDNHPSIIKDTNNSKNRKKRIEKKPKPIAGEASSVASKGKTSITEVEASTPTRKIILAGKLGLPKVVVASVKKVPVAVIEEEDEDAENSGGEGDAKSDRSWEEREKGKGGKRRKETPEEKRARKLKVKEERRESRATKKQVKQAFSSEYQHQNYTAGRKQDIDNISVFKYT